MRPRRLAPLLLAIAGCALRPAGEDEERDRIEAAGRVYAEDAAAPALPGAPSVEDYLRVAFAGNAELRRRYEEWRAAIEQVPQDSSFPDAALSFGYLMRGGGMKAWDRTTLGIGNEPMVMIPYPGKLAAAGRRALEEARAAGLEFEAARFDLQERVRAAYLDLALFGESIRLQEERVRLDEMKAAQAHAAVGLGRAAPEAALVARTELDLARSDLESLHAAVGPARAAMNALLGRAVEAPVPLPDALPAPRALPRTDAEVLALGAERNPALGALARTVAGREDALDLARQAYIPDVSLSFSLTGSASQAVGAMATLPLRLEAIAASIRQAEAGVRAAEAARTQYARDLAARFVLDLAVLRNDERQVELFETAIIPRIRRTIDLARAGYAAGRTDFAALLAAERTHIDARVAVARLRIEREKALAAVEAAAAVDIETLRPAGAQPAS